MTNLNSRIPILRPHPLMFAIIFLAATMCVHAELERSFWLHASLGLHTQRNYFGSSFPETPMPTEQQVQNAAHLLTNSGGANRLYLIYHREVPIEEVPKLFTRWRKACPKDVEIVPTLVTRMYDRAQTSVFTEAELVTLTGFFKHEVNAKHCAVYDIASKRDLSASLTVLSASYPRSLIRVGLQPDELLGAPYCQGVADTWSAFCHGKRNDADWLQPGFGASTLRKWVDARNSGSVPVVWDLVAVAWDYSATERGAYPGYDDAEKNMPLPDGRNRAAAAVIRETAKPHAFGGFSSDLYILHENSRSAKHDGTKGSFYECLKRGEDYGGYFAAPYREITALYREMRARGE